MQSTFARSVLTMLIAIFALGAVLIPGHPASAGVRPVHSMASGSQRVDCSTIHWQVIDVPYQGEITNWNSTSTCGLEQEALVKCEQRGFYRNFHGPWRTTERTSQAPCGSGYNIYCAAIKDKRVSGGAAAERWVWPNSDCDPSSPVTLTASASAKRCGWNGEFRDNYTNFPIWAKTKFTSNTCTEAQQRSYIKWCLRGICTGHNAGGWVEPVGTWSQANPSDARASMSGAWMEVRFTDGTAQCYRFFPSTINWFTCNPDNP